MGSNACASRDHRSRLKSSRNVSSAQSATAGAPSHGPTFCSCNGGQSPALNAAAAATTSTERAKLSAATDCLCPEFPEHFRVRKILMTARNAEVGCMVSCGNWSFTKSVGAGILGLASASAQPGRANAQSVSTPPYSTCRTRRYGHSAALPRGDVRSHMGHAAVGAFKRPSAPSASKSASRTASTSRSNLAIVTPVSRASAGRVWPVSLHTAPRSAVCTAPSEPSPASARATTWAASEGERCADGSERFVLGRSGSSAWRHRSVRAARARRGVRARRSRFQRARGRPPARGAAAPPACCSLGRSHLRDAASV
eukprot:scaffold222055_cov32-Tisochrysis_lutea.AAC.3